MESTSLICSCSCGGELHGINITYGNHSVKWKSRRPQNRKLSLIQEARAGQIFMFDCTRRKRDKAK